LDRRVGGMRAEGQRIRVINSECPCRLDSSAAVDGASLVASPIGSFNLVAHDFAQDFYACWREGESLGIFDIGDVPHAVLRLIT
jgi:hypothetical protein